MNVMVTILNGEAVADSRDIATAFGRRHDHVLASIRDMIERRPDLAPTFRGKVARVATGDGGQRDTPYYLMNRKGFVVLVGGFKGDKAHLWDAGENKAFWLGRPQ